MNGLSIVVILIFLICAVVGYTKGFIKIVASLAATLLTIVVVTFLTPYVSDMILKMVPIEDMMQEKCMEILIPEAEEGGESTLPEGVESSKVTQITLIENAQLPEMFQQLLLENNNDEIYKILGVTSFVEYVGSYLAKIIANIAGFLLTFLVVSIVLRVVLYILGGIGKLPVIGGLNRAAGGIAGLGIGLIIVWVLFIVITLVYDTEIGKQCFENIAQNEFLTKLYDQNILMNYITKFRG